MKRERVDRRFSGELPVRGKPLRGCVVAVKREMRWR